MTSPWLERVEGADYARLAALRARGVEPYPHVFDQRGATRLTASEFHALYGGDIGTSVSSTVAFAGRIYGIREASKRLVFIDVGGSSAPAESTQSRERLQVMMRADAWQGAAGAFETLRDALCVGDVAGFVGEPVRTRAGELSLEAHSGQLLTASVRSVPPVIEDQERRYRERSLDLIVNERVRTTFVTRARVISALRRFCEDELGLLEVETPVLQMQAGGAAARPFHTFQNALKLPMVMRISPELFLKMLIVGHLGGGVYEIGKQFRNESIDQTHNPEFTSIELYWPYHDYKDLMRMTERLLAQLARVSLELPAATRLFVPAPDGGEPLDFTGPYPELSIYDELEAAWNEHVGAQLSFPATNALDTPEANLLLDAWAESAGVKCEAPRTTARLLDKLIGHYIEPRCRSPTFVTNHPQLMCPLAKPHRTRAGLTERFELFICGLEYVNAYTELNDPEAQRREFHAQLDAADKGDDEAQLTDEPFCRALEYGLPPTAGWGMGIDRLIMLLTQQPTIRDVLLFPAMRPLAAAAPPRSSAAVAAAATATAVAVATSPEHKRLTTIDHSLYQKRPALEDAVARSPVLSPSGQHTVLIRRETKSLWEGRVALTPRHVRALVSEYALCVHVQRSPTRAFSDAEYEAAGATLVDEVTTERVIVGLKELPVDDMHPNRLYILFSHSFKGQPHSMYRIEAAARHNLTLVDYELIREPAAYAHDPLTPVRAMKFGPFAGYGGLIDTLHGVGLRLMHRGLRTPFVHIGRAYEYMTLEDAHLALRRVGDAVAEHGLPDALLPFVVAFTSTGAVATAALEIFRHVQPQRVEAHELATLAQRSREQQRRTIYYVVLTHEHMVERTPGGVFDKADYYAHPEAYTPIFHERYLPHVSVLVNGIYWEPRFPRLVTREQARAGACARLIAIGDLGCDVAGPIEFFTHSTRIPTPYYAYDPKRDVESSQVDANGILIYGVDHVPGETPVDASTYFGDRFLPYVALLARHDQCVPYDEIHDLPGHLLHAMQVRHGRTVGRFAERVEVAIERHCGEVSVVRDEADIED